MAVLRNPLDDAPDAASTPTNTDTAGSIGSGAVAGSTSGAVGNAAPTGTQAGVDSTSANQTDANRISSLNQGFDFSPLVDTIKGQGTAARSAIDSANTSFNTGLGATPTFGAPQQTTLTNAINGTDTLAHGADILGYNPATPANINNASYDPLIDQYQRSANQTTNREGISSLLGGLRPDLTPGDIAYDALAAGQNQNFQNQSRALVNDANQVYNLGQSATTGAGTALGQRAKDVAAFDAAGKGFVNSQLDSINNQLTKQQSDANAYDQAVNTAFQAQRGGTALGTLPANYYNFDPARYTQQDFAGQQPGNPYDAKVNPNDYLQYNPGGLVTAGDTATAAQVQQFNNANALLAQNNRLVSAPRVASNIGLDNARWQDALDRAAAARNQSDIAWLAAHQPPPAPVVAAVNNVVDGGNGGGGAEGSGGGGSGGDNGSGGSAGSGGENGAGDSFHKGGLVQIPDRGNIATTRKAVNSKNSYLKPNNFEAGGQVAMNAGPPGVDTVPARVNNGEYVLTAPSTADLDSQDLQRLNNIDKASPAVQAMMRDALHQALSKALQGKDSDALHALSPPSGGSPPGYPPLDLNFKAQQSLGTLNDAANNFGAPVPAQDQQFQRRDDIRNGKIRQ